MSQSRKVIISACLTGAMTSKQACPSLPITPAEIASDAVACVKAGASILHIHVRDGNAQFTMETEYFVQAVDAIKEAFQKENLDAIINLTTSNGPGTDEIRLAHLEKIRPEMCSFDAGTLNWGDAIFENSPVFLKKLGKKTQELDIKPEIEIFDGSMIGNAVRLMQGGYLTAPCHFQFILGVPGGLDGTIDSLNFMLPKLPAGSTWSLSGIGKAHMPMMLAGLAAGCDGIRVGLEDNIWMSKGVPATNEKLVARAAELIRLTGREVADAAQAREMLGIRRKTW